MCMDNTLLYQGPVKLHHIIRCDNQPEKFCQYHILLVRVGALTVVYVPGTLPLQLKLPVGPMSPSPRVRWVSVGGSGS